MHIFLIVILTTISTSFALYNSLDITELTWSDFDEFVDHGDEFWLVEFYAPWCGYCQQFATEFERAALALKGVVNVGAVNCDEETKLAEKFHVKSYPTFQIFVRNERKPIEYNGERSAQALVDFVLKTLGSKVKSSLNSDPQSDGATVELTDDNFEEIVFNSNNSWMVKIYAPWCGHCKDLEPQWIEAAKSLKGQVKFGDLDATVHTTMTEKYIDKGYPTIKYFPAKSDITYLGEVYDGQRDAESIVLWAESKLKETLLAPKINEIVDQATLINTCENMVLCVITILPNIIDCQADCRNDYLDILSNMAEIFKLKPWGWVWTEAGAQSDLEDVLDIGGFGYPALAVVHWRKYKFSIFRGSFSKMGLDEFLNDIASGRGATSLIKVNKLPNINTVDPWDGKDAEIFDDANLEEEEEVDLDKAEL